MKKTFFALVATTALALAAPAFAGGKDGGWGFEQPKPRDASASVVAIGSAGTLCSGHCKTGAVVKESTSAAANTKPSAYFEYEVDGWTGGWGFAHGGLTMESDMYLGGAGYAKANKWPSEAASAVQGSVNSVGLGDQVSGSQSISGSVDGWGYDSNRHGGSGSGGSIEAHQSMTASSSGGNHASAAAASSTQVGASANSGF